MHNDIYSRALCTSDGSTTSSIAPHHNTGSPGVRGRNFGDLRTPENIDIGVLQVALLWYVYLSNYVLFKRISTIQ